MRIVVKVGSSTLTHATGKINLKIIEKLVTVLADIKNSGNEVVLVSSGAMALGVTKLGLRAKPSLTSKKQAVAAVGQSDLMSIYDKTFAEYGYNVGQILLTKDALDNKDRKKHVVNTFNALLNYGCIPIVNENDSVETDEIKFGDNDTLSAIVAICVNADILIILSDIDALYDSDPHINPNAKPIFEVTEITDEIKSLAGDTVTNVGTGGMVTKINAAEKTTAAGIDTYIVQGKHPEIIYSILEGEKVGTVFRGRKEGK